MLSTLLTIDINEWDSKDATAAAVIDTSNDDVNTGDLLRIDIDVAGTGGGTGSFQGVNLIGTTLKASGTGSVSLTGQGGDDGHD